MAKFLIENTGPLNGVVDISGSKNAVLPLLAAAILTDDSCEIMEVPRLKDVEVMCELLQSVGLTVNETGEDKGIRISLGSGLSPTTEIPYSLTSKMRASVLLMGPLLARTGFARIPLPGGCAIGARPINLHLKGFKALGATVTEHDTYVETRAEKLVGTTIYLDSASVGATENIMMAAALAEGITIIENVAQEPEIVDLANFLNKMGAKIKGAGTDTVKIEGVKSLHGAKHSVIPDRIEMGTFMVAAAITKGQLLIRGGLPDHVRPIIAKLKEAGTVIEEENEGLLVRGDVNPLIATDIKTLPYPSFPTDMQAQFMAMLAVAEGSSKVIESVFENRFMHVAELNRMGANIETDGNKALIPGGKRLKGAEIVATDLRAGAALVLAALVAEDETIVSDIYHIERGYEDFMEKFNAIGASIKRLD